MSRLAWQLGRIIFCPVFLLSWYSLVIGCRCRLQLGSRNEKARNWGPQKPRSLPHTYLFPLFLSLRRCRIITPFCHSHSQVTGAGAGDVDEPRHASSRACFPHPMSLMGISGKESNAMNSSEDLETVVSRFALRFERAIRTAI